MMLVFSIVVLFISQLIPALLHSSCSQLNLNPKKANNVNDDNYLIDDEILSSSIVKVSLRMKKRVNDLSGFIMGGSFSSKLTGLWEPLSSSHGQLIQCSSSEQAVSNPTLIVENVNRSRFDFYWIAPPSFSDSVVFVATIYEGNRTRFLQSYPIEIGRGVSLGRNLFGLIDLIVEERFIFAEFCASSPCKNNGTCISDPDYPFCRCVPPWNGLVCNLRK